MPRSLISHLPEGVNIDNMIRWRQRATGDLLLQRVQAQLQKLVRALRNAPAQEAGDAFSEREYLEGIEMLAFTATEATAQFAAAGVNWGLADKARFLCPTIDINQVLVSYGKRNGLVLDAKVQRSIKAGTADFLAASQHSRAWFEALDFAPEDFAYLLWAAAKTMDLLESPERIPGFTKLALTTPSVTGALRQCKSPTESILFMQLAVKGLLPPTLEIQYQVKTCSLDFAIPSIRLAIECDGSTYGRVRLLASQMAELTRLGWTITRFSDSQIIEEPEACALEIFDKYPWRETW